jgi:hypothetical protein
VRKTYLTIIIILIHLFSFGQQKKQDKNEAVTKELIGSWKLDYALYTTKMGGVVSREKSKIFHTDTIHFFSDMTFRFTSHDTKNIDVRTHTGNWEITKKGRILIYKNRQAQPPFDAPSPDLFSPIKIVNANRIKIYYEVHVYGDKFDPKPDGTPVFFERIK